MQESQTQEVLLLGDIAEVGKRVIEVNKDGSVKATDLKAIQWYIVHHGLKLLAPSVFPTYCFRNEAGEEVKVHLADIQDEYRDFKKSTHGKRIAA